MRVKDGRLRSSPTDLANFLACRHRTSLDHRVARRELPPPTWDDPLAVVLRNRGQDHERQYVESFRAEGLTVRDLTQPLDAPRLSDEERVAETLEAMRTGADVIVQAPLGAMRGGQLWFGYADVLRRVAGPSALGEWHYEVHDTKLAAETKGGTLLQLGIYTDLLGLLQGRTPADFVVVTPKAVERYRYEDYAAFFRLAQSRYATAVDARSDVYPNPTDHCEVCGWWDRCNARRRQDDHLRFVAGLGAAHQTELEARAVSTLQGLARVPVPIPFKPKRGARETYERLREQARLQDQQRTLKRPVHELLPVEKGRGFCRLPAPSSGDVFLDLEGDPYVAPAGREYLFGLGRVRADGTFDYRCWWASNDEEEREAFNELIGEMRGVIEAEPGAHIYHYAPYEPTAMKRLMGRYAICEQDVDWLLRGGRFVDLYAVVREALRAGVESYSIKKLEPFYGFTREIELPRAGDERRVVELALETGGFDAVAQSVRDAVEGYNRDDVRSTVELRTWLESLRAEAVRGGSDIQRFVGEPGEPSEKVTVRAARVEALRAELLSSEAARTEPEAIRILAYLLDAHYREDKVGWWEYYRMLDMPDDDLFDESRAVAGLAFVEKVREVVGKNGRRTGSEIHRYTFPVQEMDLEPGDEVYGRDGKFGTVEDVNRETRTLDIKRTKATLGEPHPPALFEFAHYDSGALAESIARMAEHVLSRGLDFDGPYAAGLSLLVGRPPQIGGQPLGQVSQNEGEGGAAFAVRLATRLTRSVLPIQGPPGAGKTYTGARMVVELIRAGKKVGVTANSHKVVANLMEAIGRAAAQAGVKIRLARKPKDGDEAELHGIRHVTDTTQAINALTSGEVQVLGGTAWLWSTEASAGAVDVLVVDEAGQMSLAHVMAVAQAASSVVLLGDPQQLEQPQKGSHPDGVGVAALQHILGGDQTIARDRGVFLPETWRLAPDICRFTSECFYDGRLESKPGLDAQRVVGPTPSAGAGLRIVPVDHEGCRNASDEEVETVERIVKELVAPGVTWVDEQGARAMTAADVLVVAPYNAHVSRLAARLDSLGVRVGTVDRFQGQEAPVVIYAMATSSPEDAPRGMEFLYSRNRLNVATSRAKALAIVVASPRLFEPDCRTPRQMRLANALCRFRELAT